LFFIEFLQKGKIIYLFLNWIAFTLALFCKETAVFFPFIFIIYFFTFYKEKHFDKKYLFMILLYAASGILWYWLRSKAIGGFSNPSDTVGPIEILSNLRSIPESFAQFFLLINIAPIPGFTVLKTLIGLGVIVLIITVFVKNKERPQKEKIFCMSWFLILMLPPMLFKHPYIDYLDHRFFLPFIGIILFLLFVFPQKWLLKGDIKISWLMVVPLVLLSSFTFIKSGSYSDPVTFYNSAISQNPNSSFAYNNRGNYRCTKGDFEGALADCNKAIALCPTYFSAYYGRGVIKANTGDKQGALEDYNKAISIYPNYVDAYNNRGLLKSKMGDMQGALADYNMAISIDNKYANAYTNKGCANIVLGKYKDAINDFNKLISISPDNANAYLNRGYANLSLDNFNAAIDDFSKCISISPNDVKGYVNRAYAKYYSKDISGALEDCELAHEADPADKISLNLKAKIQQELQAQNK
jgi:tetratricopeptide (TPR) repeat protein